MVVFTVFIALPLSLSRKLDRLSHLSAFSIGFYYFFALYVSCSRLTFEYTGILLTE